MRYVRSVSLLVIVVGVLGAAAAPIGPTQAGHPFDPIQPGDRVGSPEGGCTLGFIFDGADGGTYAGIAGHCVEVGQRVRTGGYGAFGTVVYDDDARQDFALIAVDDDKAGHVRPAVRGHPAAPTGYTSIADTAPGDVVRLSGYGAGFDLTSTTRERRVGILLWDTAREYCVDGPVLWGDSGGPVVHDATGKALGIVSRLDPVDCPGWLVGSTVEGAILQAAEDGYLLSLRTV